MKRGYAMTITAAPQQPPPNVDLAGLRVAIVAPQFPPDIGGMERYAFEVACELATRNAVVTIFTVPHSKGEQQLPGIDVRPVLCGKMLYDRPLLLSHADEFDVWHVMNSAWAWVALSLQPAVLSAYGNDFISPNPVAGFDLRDRWRLPKGSRLDLRIAQWRTPRLMRRAMSKMRTVILVSKYTEQAFLARFPECNGRTVVSYAGVSPAWFENSNLVGRTNSPARFVTACRLSEPRKNVDIVLRAIARLNGEFDFSYHVLGDGHLRPQLERQAAELGIGDRVKFLGFVSDDVLRATVSASDLFILTSSLSQTTVEGFGIVYLEANACGVPVLAARLGGAAEAVEEGVSGMFVDEPTDTSVELALRRFLSGQITFNPTQCREFASRFAWAAVVDVIVRAYSTACGKVERYNRLQEIALINSSVETA